ncbi:MAG TPA: tetratricopeptide repeat protein [Candidatus Cloacimonadota bacterium]|nr:tetratricopeptide repeat protein [Candidatus Cloacimonadota bacterium]HQL14720.1 tetratricopeptide repeat protein [Candidatus Cloacimonadota bacterium]
MPEWLKKERCKVCRDERFVRYCLRVNKNLGWQCCNTYRSDGKCPSACPYTPHQAEGSNALPTVKSDSRTEFLDWLDKYLPFWIHAPLNELQGRSAYELSRSEDGKERLLTWLGKFAFQDNGIIILLNKYLNLQLPINKEVTVHPEELAKQYLNAVITQDWDKVLQFHTGERQIEQEYFDLFIQTLMKHPLLPKVKNQAVINAGFTAEQTQAFVFCELNHKENWTFIFIRPNKDWQLLQTVWGTLQDYYMQKDEFRNLALLLSNHHTDEVQNRLRHDFEVYPLCPDLYYYEGLTSLQEENTETAEKDFQLALILEPDWTEPLFQLALLDMQRQNYASALAHWQTILRTNPQDINVLNNMGICYLGLEQKEKALQIWQQALLFDPKAEIVKKNLEHLKNG